MKLFELLDVIYYKQSIYISNEKDSTPIYEGKVRGVPEELEHKEIKCIWNNPIFDKLVIEVED